MSALPLLLYALIAARLTTGLPGALDLAALPDLFALGVAAAAMTIPGASTPAPGAWRRRGLLDQVPSDALPLAAHALVLGIARDLVVGTPLGASALAFVLAGAALRGLWHRVRPGLLARAAVSGGLCAAFALGAELAAALADDAAPAGAILAHGLPPLLGLAALTALLAAVLIPGLHAAGALLHQHALLLPDRSAAA